jgi:5-methylcytosine-specific restriction endonuclease McrA
MSQNKNRNSHQKRELKRILFGSRSEVGCCFCGCGLTFNQATLEHIIPLSEGGGWKPTNLALSCSRCNSHRGSIEFELFRKWRKANPNKPPPRIDQKKPKKMSLDNLLDQLSVQFRPERLEA